MLDLINTLRDKGGLKDLNQIAFLFRSVKNDKAVALAEFLEENEELILAGITHWASGNGDRTRGDLRTLYRDYTTVASSSGIRLAPDADRVSLVAQLTAILSSYWWGASF